jgi:putative transcriptional regulator
MNRKVLRIKGETDGEPLQYTLCGLDDVYLLSGWKRVQTPYGDGITIKDVDGLHRAIGLNLVRQKKALSGPEIRFLRKEMGLTQEELGERVCKSGQQIARWEKGQSEISGSAELLLRVLYLQHLGEHPLLAEIVKHLRAIEDRGNQKQVFKPTRDGWQAIAA